jgi:peptidoglycan/xylan/chitin deacetylase (PgdA/CDA1 family)
MHCRPLPIVRPSLKAKVKLPVLMYHRVGPRRPGVNPRWTVSPAHFEKQMKWLMNHGYTPIGTRDWVAGCAGERSLPDKPVLITFDDGYADIAESALPLLVSYRFAAVVLIVTDFIGGTNLWKGEVGLGMQSLLSAAQIRSWAAQGIEFGSHTRTHPDLTTLSPLELSEEVGGSVGVLEQLTGSRPTAFAYPYGCWNEAVREYARGIFDVCLSTIPGFNWAATDHSLMRRLAVSPTDGIFNFACLMRFGFRPGTRIRNWRGRWRPPAEASEALSHRP